MEASAVMLADLPRIVYEMIEAAVRADPVLAWAGTIDDPATLRDAVRRARPQCVVVGVHGPELPARATELLDELPGLVVVGLDATRGAAYLHAPGAAVRVAGDVSPEGLVLLIRGLVGPRGPVPD